MAVKLLSILIGLKFRPYVCEPFDDRCLCKAAGDVYAYFDESLRRSGFERRQNNVVIGKGGCTVGSDEEIVYQGVPVARVALKLDRLGNIVFADIELKIYDKELEEIMCEPAVIRPCGILGYWPAD